MWITINEQKYLQLYGCSCGIAVTAYIVSFVGTIIKNIMVISTSLSVMVLFIGISALFSRQLSAY